MDINKETLLKFAQIAQTILIHRRLIKWPYLLFWKATFSFTYSGEPFHSLCSVSFVSPAVGATALTSGGGQGTMRLNVAEHGNTTTGSVLIRRFGQPRFCASMDVPGRSSRCCGETRGRAGSFSKNISDCFL